MTTQPQPERTDLASWLLSCIEAREAETRDGWGPHLRDCAIGEGVYWSYNDCDCGEPARVLAECAAKRKIVLAYEAAMSAPTNATDGMANILRYVVQVLAQPYADRPGFDEAWK